MLVWTSVTPATQHFEQLYYPAITMEWNGIQQTSEKFIVNIDTQNKIGVLLGYSYALPLQCQMD